MDERTGAGGWRGPRKARWPFARLPTDPHLAPASRGRRFGGGFPNRFAVGLLGLGIRGSQRQHACCVGDRWAPRLCGVHVLGEIRVRVREERDRLRASRHLVVRRRFLVWVGERRGSSCWVCSREIGKRRRCGRREASARDGVSIRFGNTMSSSRLFFHTEIQFA